MKTHSVNLLKNLSDFMLTEETINYYLSYSIHNNINNVVNERTNSNEIKKDKIKKPFFIPKQKDTLFWCFYIITNGVEKYQLIPNINVVVEKTLKIEYVEKLRKKKDLLKMNKCAPLLHIENMLVNEFKIDMKTFLALCVYENKNIMYVKNKIYYELEMNSLEEINIIHFFPEKKNYGLETDVFMAEEYKKSLYKIYNVDKPIKAISSYKSDELIEIGEKLGLKTKKEDGRTILKKDLYEKIIQYLS
jgi:hypothetical protein